MFSNVNLTDCVVNLISILASLCAFDVQPSKDVLVQDANYHKFYVLNRARNCVASLDDSSAL